jgi:hypothetical protein
VSTTIRTIRASRLSILFFAAMAVAILASLASATGALADARDINRNATSLTHSCTQDGGTATTTTDSNGKTTLTCKGGSHGDWTCTGVETNIPTCTQAKTGRPFDPIAAIDNSAGMYASDGTPAPSPQPAKGAAKAPVRKVFQASDDLW